MLDVSKRMVSEEKLKVPKSKREVASGTEGTSSPSQPYHPNTSLNHITHS